MKRSRGLIYAALMLMLTLTAGCGEDNELLEAASVTLTLQDDSQTVDLGQIPRQTFANAPYARLSEVVAAAFPQESLAALQADFLDAPGVSPASKDYCTQLIPVPGELLQRAFIQLESRNLLWEEALQYPGCMSWRDVATIALSRR